MRGSVKHAYGRWVVLFVTVLGLASAGSLGAAPCWLLQYGRESGAVFTDSGSYYFSGETKKRRPDPVADIAAPMVLTAQFDDPIHHAADDSGRILCAQASFWADDFQGCGLKLFQWSGLDSEQFAESNIDFFALGITQDHGAIVTRQWGRPGIEPAMGLGFLRKLPFQPFWAFRVSMVSPAALSNLRPGVNATDQPQGVSR